MITTDRQAIPARAVAIQTVLWIGCLLGTSTGATADDKAVERGFETVVLPFVKNYCLGCHGALNPKAKLDLSADRSVEAVVKNEAAWDLVLDRLEAEEMPPAKANRQPSPHERRAVIEWVRGVREVEARKNAGDPGRVWARRLNSAEFDNTIRDLTGADLRPAREFPVDPANLAGFDNSGESLAMSPALVEKYLAAARRVADHLVLKPKGFAFAPHPVVTDSERDRYCVRRIIDFYTRHRIEFADYFMAAWRFRNREALGQPSSSLADFANDAQLSAGYLARIWEVLEEPEPAESPLGKLQALWHQLPAAVSQEAGIAHSGNAAQPQRVRRSCEAMRDLVVRLRKEYEPRVSKIYVKGISDGSQPLVLWWNRQVAGRRMSARAADPPEVQRFCNTFPSAFFVSERPPYSEPDSGIKGRLLTAGFHLMQGFFRDDAPLCELVLDDAGRRELDELWRELNFVTLAPIRQFKDFIFFERGEPPRFMMEPSFNFARSEDKDATTDVKINRLHAAYLAKARRIGAGENAVKAMDEYFDSITAAIRTVEKSRLDAEPSHLEALVSFAQRAYRRPLSSAESTELLSFYRDLRARDGLSHEDAIRDSVASVLMSPHFCYRVEPTEAGEAARPVSDFVLASRLSYFLWSSMPDQELLAHAAAGNLHEPEMIVAQTRRMLRDGRIRGFAEDFAGNWLEFRRFEQHNGVDRQQFPAFSNDLRRAMQEEPIRFVMNLARNDRPVSDLLDADYTFVNPVLAKHYGMAVTDRGPDDWVRVDAARQFGRGGLLPMAIFLTKNSPGLRTSPVKRGYWVVRRVLGERIPAPPPDVPELPMDEANLGDWTLPQLLARHRKEENCAACHRRFDSIGLVFEGYGPIGERRDHDRGGRPVDASAIFPDGSERAGVDGLRHYLSERRRQEFTDNFCRKLLTYALGRGTQLSDQATIDAMRARLDAEGQRFGALVETIVTSPMFLNKRGRDDPRE
jgi:Protein of unknown function (DUF1592)/Protein of unknown function (DUF1588)/Protein of unknown function (DUF1587)/Protein of unknown function (DUF1585)/Protein of unknown function (DUF1595)